MLKQIELLRTQMKTHNLDAYIVFSSDPHQCEYLPDHYKNRAYISNFTGSAGTVLITHTAAILWTDGRYFLQAEKQLEGTSIQLYRMQIPNVPTLEEYLAEHCKTDSRIGMDGAVVSVEHYTRLKKAVHHAELITDLDLVGSVWENRPPIVRTSAFILPEKYTGHSAKEKIAKVQEQLRQKNVDSTVIGALEDISYLFNVRAHDIPYNPILTAYAIIDQTQAAIFTGDYSLDTEIREYLNTQGVTCRPYDNIFDAVSKLQGTVYIDPSRINVRLKKCLKADVIEGANITSQMKAVKNSTEIAGFKAAMVKDGVAMIKIIKWITDNLDTPISEYDVSEQLTKFRAENESFIEPSFETIAGYGGNAAIIHYAPKKDTCAQLQPKGLFLLDSGGHYSEGTTDITRTIALGKLSNAEKEDYTLVLKGHIQLALARFPENTPGYALDAITRAPLWRRAKNYHHGTGHGVGHVLAVHEGPQSISTRWIDTPITSGMVTSNEPGIYIPNSHGIRIENLIVCEPAKEQGLEPFLQFETITLCPIDTAPIIREMLLQEEIDWLNTYHAAVQKMLLPHLDDAHQALLLKLTKAF